MVHIEITDNGELSLIEEICIYGAMAISALFWMSSIYFVLGLLQ